MHLVQHDAPSAPAAVGGYTNALEVVGAERFLFVSGQIPQTADGEIPTDFEGQCHQVWSNVLASLSAAGLGVENLVKVTTYLARRTDADVNSAVRRKVLGDHRPALTVVLAGIFDSAWLLEIEAIAAA
jgi:enamine deaminase RidA (YjgF/YER057c/UK114 family)